MAHWIVDFKGFSGSYYRCSECRECWNDIFRDVSKEDRCPECGSPMDDENEYVEHTIPTIPTIQLGKFIKKTDESEIVRKYEEQVAKLITVSGYDVEKLIELFAAGYTLQPPNYKDLTPWLL